MKYGENCALNCGKCASAATCNETSGHCDGGCANNLTAPMCLDGSKLYNAHGSFRCLIKNLL